MGLFNTHHYHTKTETRTVPYEKTITVNEHRAPTDKSVELLNDFQKRAEGNIIHSINCTDNIFEYNAFFIQANLPSDNLTFYAKFKLNGKEYVIKKEIARVDIYKEVGSSDDMVDFVYKTLSSAIITEILKSTNPVFLNQLRLIPR